MTHDHAALVLYLGGRATHEQRTQRTQLELGPGDVLLIPAGEPHRLIAARQMDIWGLGIHTSSFAGVDMAPLIEPFERVRAGATAVVHIPGERQASLAHFFQELKRESEQAPQVSSESVQRSLLTLILAEVSRAGSWATAGAAHPPLVTEALRFIERHCLEPISLRDVAKAVNRSPAHVATALKQATGRTAQQWIIAGRLGEARKRLLHTDEFVDVIAERVGYADVTHFIRTFRRAHGVTPAAWRALRLRSARPAPPGLLTRVGSAVPEPPASAHGSACTQPGRLPRRP